MKTNNHQLTHQRKQKNKRLIVICFITIFLITIGVLEQVFVQKSLTGLKLKTDELITKVENSVSLNSHTSNSDNYEDTQKLLSQWRKAKKIYEIILTHTYTQDIDKSAGVLSTHMKENDYTMVLTDLNSMSNGFENLKEYIKPHWHTIF